MAQTQLRRVLFRLDSGGAFGLGHFMRCKALADALLAFDIECHFAMQYCHDSKALSEHRAIIIQDNHEFFQRLEAYDALIIDHYDFSSEVLSRLAQVKQALRVVIDDLCNRGTLYADIIINSLATAHSLPYHRDTPQAQLLLGKDYILLGRDFLKMNAIAYQQRQAIVIGFGGSDVTNLTLPVLKAVKNSALGVYPIVVITGAGVQNHAIIHRYCQEQGLTHRHNVHNMAEILAQAKLAICAAGSSLFELAYCGVPSILAVVADNQRLCAQQQSQQGWCRIVDCTRQNKAWALVKQAQQLLQEPALEQLSHIARSQIDGNGAVRIAQQLIHMYKTKRAKESSKIHDAENE